MDNILVGISSCLMGDEVRYNGGHKRSIFCLDTLSQAFSFQRFCPEVAIGMGVPRQTIRLVGDFEQPRAVGSSDQRLDVTDALRAYGELVSEQAKAFSGYIFMKESPSCGLFSTKVYGEKAPLPGKRAGLFAEVLQRRLPLLPMEEEGRLHDPGLRENFVARVFAYHDWRQQVLADPSAHALVKFHSRYKYFVMAHSQALYKRLGQWVAQVGLVPIDQAVERYAEVFFSGILKPPSRRNHTNVLYHLLGYLKQQVGGELRKDLLDAVEQYRLGEVPLIVPLTLLKHYLSHFANDYINSQFYLDPYPASWGLRNQI
jgi:uncharacterized protein YbgA (DUF1722 family)/uncharacterized protein YbbK (DUF523 family)